MNTTIKYLKPIDQEFDGAVTVRFSTSMVDEVGVRNPDEGEQCVIIEITLGHAKLEVAVPAGTFTDALCNRQAGAAKAATLRNVEHLFKVRDSIAEHAHPGRLIRSEDGFRHIINYALVQGINGTLNIDSSEILSDGLSTRQSGDVHKFTTCTYDYPKEVAIYTEPSTILELHHSLTKEEK